MKLPNWVIPGSAVLLFGACAVLQSPAEQALALARIAGFAEVKVPDWRLKAFVRRTPTAATSPILTVYIESDGAPWRVADEPPADPTPHKPMVLHMAADDPGGTVAYLGRPCQYLDAGALARCNPSLWIQGRFSEDAVAATDAAVSAIKAAQGAAVVKLVGYSGGGAMAALVAARRKDVTCLVTIAAPLDTEAWTAALKVSRLAYSLNPADFASKLGRLPQTHFRGGEDFLVPAASTQGFLARVPGAQVIDKQSYDHQCCWKDAWKDLRAQSCLAR